MARRATGKGSPAFAGREPQSRDAGTFAADAYCGRLRLLDTLAGETEGPFLAGAHVMTADCVAMATLQFAEGLYGVPLPTDCPVLAAWYAMFSTRPSAALVPFPAPLLAVASVRQAQSVPSLQKPGSRHCQ